MVDAAWKQAPGLVLGRANGDLYLRIVGSARDGQLVRLSAPKCTIGSARGCTLRLRAAGVRPVHCLILRGSHGTVARASNTGARLNGLRFSDAPLVPGDRLSLGPIELEVLAEHEAATRTNESAARADKPLPESALTASDAGRGYRQQAQSRGRLAQNLIRVVRDLRAQIARLGEQAQAQQTDHAAQADSPQRRVVEGHERLVADWQRERQRWESTAQARRAELDREAEALELATLALEQDRQRLAAQDAAARDLDHQRNEHTQVEHQLRHQREAFAAEQRAHRSDSDRARAELERERAELAELRDRLTGQQSELDRERQQCAQERTLALQEVDQRRLELEKQQNELDALRQTVREDQDTAAKECAAEHARLNDQRAELERERGELASRASACDQRQSEHEQLRHELDEERASLEKQYAELHEKRAECERDLGSVQQLHAEAGQACAELESARAEVAQARSEIDARQTELKEAESRLAIAQLELEDGKRELERQRKAIEAAQQEHHQASSAAKDSVELEQARLALAGALARQSGWAMEQLAWETAQSATEEGFRRQQVDIDQREQALAQKSREQLRLLEEKVTRFAEMEDALSAEREAFAQTCEESEAQLAQRQLELDRAANEADALRQELEAERQDVSAQQAKLQESTDRLHERLAELEQLRLDLVDQRDAFHDERAAWETEQRQAVADEDAYAAGSDAEVDSEETHEVELAQADVSGDETELEPAVGDATDTVRSDAALFDTQLFATPPDDDFDEAGPKVDRRSVAAEQPEREDSIEEYMAALLNRVRGGDVAEPSEAKQDRRKSDAREHKRSKAAVSPDDEAAMSVVDITSSPGELTRRAPVPVSNLAAMREVANREAKLAIDAHGRRRLVHSALVTSSAALGCLVATLLFLSLVAAQHTALRTLGMAGFVGAIFWLFAAGTALEQLIVARRAQQSGMRENLERADRERSSAADKPSDA